MNKNFVPFVGIKKQKELCRIKNKANFVPFVSFVGAKTKRNFVGTKKQKELCEN
jgi:hypothetical protein